LIKIIAEAPDPYYTSLQFGPGQVRHIDDSDPAEVPGLTCQAW
jgi:hypothetical protein